MMLALYMVPPEQLLGLGVLFGYVLCAIVGRSFQRRHCECCSRNGDAPPAGEQP